MFLTQFNGHGFLIRDYIRDYTKLQEGPLCPLLRAPLNKANLDRSSCRGYIKVV